MFYSIKHLLHINSHIEKIDEAISTLKGLSNWWTLQTTGEASPGKEIEFRFGESGGNKMKVISHVKNNLVEWECTAGPADWIGSRIRFILDQNAGKTRLRFEHSGWKENDDFYASCCFSWGRYLESLRQYCQTGRGEAFSSPGYRQ